MLGCKSMLGPLSVSIMEKRDAARVSRPGYKKTVKLGQFAEARSHLWFRV